MADAVSGIISGQPAYQPQQVPPVKTEAKEATPQPKGDTVTISAQGKQAVLLRTDGSTQAEEVKESPIEKATEALAGKK